MKTIALLLDRGADPTAPKTTTGSRPLDTARVGAEVRSCEGVRGLLSVPSGGTLRGRKLSRREKPQLLSRRRGKGLYVPERDGAVCPIDWRVPRSQTTQQNSACQGRSGDLVAALPPFRAVGKAVGLRRWTITVPQTAGAEGSCTRTPRHLRPSFIVEGARRHYVTIAPNACWPTAFLDDSTPPAVGLASSCSLSSRWETSSSGVGVVGDGELINRRRFPIPLGDVHAVAVLVLFDESCMRP